jgi:hypothetical protein
MTQPLAPPPVASNAEADAEPRRLAVNRPQRETNP